MDSAKSSIQTFFLSSYRRYGSELNTHDVIKCIAILTMVIDHIGFFFFLGDNWWRVPGRMAAPIFFFLVGYSPSRRLRKELWILGFLMVIADLSMSQPLLPLNILFSILCCQFFLQVIKKTDADYGGFFFLAIAMLVLHLPLMFIIEYGAIGFAFTIVGHYYRWHSENNLAPTALVFSMIFYMFAMSSGFNFTSMQNSTMLFEMIVLALVFKHFIHRDVAVPDKAKFIANACMFIGRNSLYIYVVHYLLFEVISYTMRPPLSFHFRIL